MSRVALSCKGGVATLTLRRPEARNALSRELCTALLESIAKANDLAAEGTIRCMVLNGEGLAFCAGADLKERVGMSAADVTGHSKLIADCADAIASAACPVVASIHGAALGGGLELALAADIRVVSKDAVLGFPEVELGFFPGAGGPVRLTRLVGLSNATRLLLTGERFSGTDAVALHVAHACAPGEGLEARTHEFANRLASLPERGIKALRDLLAAMDEPQTTRGFTLSRRLRDPLNAAPVQPRSA